MRCHWHELDELNRTIEINGISFPKCLQKVVDQFLFTKILVVMTLAGDDVQRHDLTSTQGQMWSSCRHLPRHPWPRFRQTFLSSTFKTFHFSNNNYIKRIYNWIGNYIYIYIYIIFNELYRLFSPKNIFFFFFFLLF